MNKEINKILQNKTALILQTITICNFYKSQIYTAFGYNFTQAIKDYYLRNINKKPTFKIGYMLIGSYYNIDSNGKSTK